MRYVKYLAFVPMLCMMAIIWGFSANNGDASASQSQGIVTRIVLFAEKVTGKELTQKEQAVWEERIHTPVRKVAHMTEYMIFACTVAFPFLLFRKTKRWVSVFSLLYCICYASLDEIHQLFVPDRSGQLRDVLIDSIGICVGVMIYRKVYGATHSSEI